MKDAAGRVIYIGKAKNLRARAGSYFLKAAAEDSRTARLVQEIRDIDYLDAESEVDALLMEARLIKDILPKFNRDLRDDKTFPYLEIHTHEDFPRVEITRTPRDRGTKLYGPFTNTRGLRGAMQVLAEDLQVPHLLAGHRRGRPALAVVPPLPAGLDPPMHGPVQLADLEGGVPQEHPPPAAVPGRQEESPAGRDAAGDGGGLEAAAVRGGGPAPRRNPPAGNARPARQAGNARAAGGLSRRSEEGAGRAAEGAAPGRSRRGPIEGIDIAHTAGTETVASVVQFIDGLPFKPGYRRLRIRSVAGRRRLGQHPRGRLAALPAAGRGRRGETLPDILLIDGGKGQLHAALAALGRAGRAAGDGRFRWPSARRRFTWPARDEPLRLSRHSYALRLLQYVRDEAHRFAQHYHHLLRKRSTLEKSEF